MFKLNEVDERFLNFIKNYPLDIEGGKTLDFNRKWDDTFYITIKNVMIGIVELIEFNDRDIHIPMFEIFKPLRNRGYERNVINHLRDVCRGELYILFVDEDKVKFWNKFVKLENFIDNEKRINFGIQKAIKNGGELNFDNLLKFLKNGKLKLKN